jgi:hypothetical protein
LWGNFIYQSKGYVMSAHAFLWGALLLGPLGLFAAIAAPHHNKPTNRRADALPVEPSIQSNPPILAAEKTLPTPATAPARSPNPSWKKANDKANGVGWVICLSIVVALAFMWIITVLLAPLENKEVANKEVAKIVSTRWNWLRPMFGPVINNTAEQRQAEGLEISRQIIKTVGESRSSILLQTESGGPGFDSMVQNIILQAHQRAIDVTLCFDYPLPSSLDAIHRAAPSIPIYVCWDHRNSPPRPNHEFIMIVDNEVYIDFLLKNPEYEFTPHTDGSEVKRAVVSFNDFKSRCRRYDPPLTGASSSK